MDIMTKCQNCGMEYDINDLDPVDHLWERVDVGEPMPAGQCPDPECQAICHLVKQGDTQGDTPTPAPREWLYRVLDMDDDGDPLDWGVVRAKNQSEAERKVTARLSDICPGEEVDVRLYEVVGYDAEGFVDTLAGVNLTIDVPEPEDED